jgi:hypothetical protein
MQLFDLLRPFPSRLEVLALYHPALAIRVIRQNHFPLSCVVDRDAGILGLYDVERAALFSVYFRLSHGSHGDIVTFLLPRSQISSVLS